jgi:hypothetical protein
MDTSEPLTAESVWAMFRETQRLQQEYIAETQMLQHETQRLHQENEKYHLETKAEAEKRQQNLDIQLDKLRKSQKNLNKLYGGISKSNGKFAEAYFYNSFKRSDLNFFGEKFDEIWKNVYVYGGLVGKIGAEYDIVFINCKSIGIVETKYQAQKQHVSELIRKAATFKINFPEYANYNIYLALAAMTFDEYTDTDCIKEGIAIIKQVGKTYVIDDKNLKVY